MHSLVLVHMLDKSVPNARVKMIKEAYNCWDHSHVHMFALTRSRNAHNITNFQVEAPAGCAIKCSTHGDQLERHKICSEVY